MIRKISLFIFFSCTLKCDVCVGQAGEWTWMKGDSTPNSPGVFGTLGVPDAANTPPGLYEAAEFKDLQGRFWLFGGAGFSSYYIGPYNTLWMYDKTTNEWTWESGSNIPFESGAYGTKGIPSINNHPGARGSGVATWVDNNGLLWLFGGDGFDGQGGWGGLNDLWSYNTATSEWTWVSGSSVIGQTTASGTQGVPDTANHPGRREESSASWVGDDNTLWLFGGEAGGSNSDLNDLWRYDPSTHEWTWMSGFNGFNQSNSYGTLGVPSSSNHPGARWAYSKWRDSQNNFWLFGGNSNYDYTLGAYNDLWKYNPATNEWTWMSGSNTEDDLGTYTAICDSSLVHFPSSRMENRACWTDNDGKFWLFGGSDDGFFNIYNDLWYYNPSTNEWTWAGGTGVANDSAVYGIQGVPDLNNHPSGYIGSIGWIDDSCQLWMFGGEDGFGAYGFSNILWKFIPGCGACSVDTSAVEIENVGENFSMNVYPNPSSGSFTIELLQSENSGEVSIDVVNVFGQKVFSSSEKVSNSVWKKEIDLCSDPTGGTCSGVYFIEIKTENVFNRPGFIGGRKKIIIMK